MSSVHSHTSLTFHMHLGYMYKWFIAGSNILYLSDHGFAVIGLLGLIPVQIQNEINLAPYS